MVKKVVAEDLMEKLANMSMREELEKVEKDSRGRVRNFTRHDGVEKPRMEDNMSNTINNDPNGVHDEGWGWKVIKCSNEREYQSYDETIGREALEKVGVQCGYKSNRKPTRTNNGQEEEYDGVDKRGWQEGLFGC
ncbi:uncharacterized protein G2W53_042081 [Senna tora]|uniref:Uncharacterized protein n=1 Tax=Senna tora TaxID=362788 RepID=A0A834VZM9_9FABA|nr:uncharacterized protein G2W53_042081 [Senna tora]